MIRQARRKCQLDALMKLPKNFDRPADEEEGGAHAEFVEFVTDQLQPELDAKAKKPELLVHRPVFKASAAFCDVILEVLACTEAQVKCHCFDDLGLTPRKQVAYDMMNVLRAFPTARTCPWWHAAWPRDFMARYGEQRGLKGRIRHIEVESREEAPRREVKENFIERR